MCTLGVYIRCVGGGVCTSGMFIYCVCVCTLRGVCVYPGYMYILYVYVYPRCVYALCVCICTPVCVCVLWEYV